MAGFEDLYKTQGKPVYRFLLALTGDAHQAEELLQETFYQAFLHIDRFEGRSRKTTGPWRRKAGRVSAPARVQGNRLRGQKLSAARPSKSP